MEPGHLAREFAYCAAIHVLFGMFPGIELAMDGLGEIVRNALTPT